MLATPHPSEDRVDRLAFGREVWSRLRRTGGVGQRFNVSRRRGQTATTTTQRILALLAPPSSHRCRSSNKPRQPRIFGMKRANWCVPKSGFVRSPLPNGGRLLREGSSGRR